MKNLLLFVAMYFAQPALAGHAVGNGGGVICIQGECRTLIEAGLRMSPDFNGVWLPTKNHFQRVQELINKGVSDISANRSDLFFSVFGKGDHFRKVDVVDRAAVDAIKKRYIEVVNADGFKVDEKDFEVVAFSSDDTVTPALTYLLPKFFELNESQQSNILVHEGMYRGRPSSHLKYVLQFESSMAELQNSYMKCPASGGSNIIKSCIDQQILAYRLGYINLSQVFGGILLNIGSYGYFKTELMGAVKINGGLGVWEIEPRRVVSLGTVDPRIPYMFSQLRSVSFKKSKLINSSASRSDYSIQLDENLSKVIMTTTCEQGKYIAACQTYELIDGNNLRLILPE